MVVRVLCVMPDELCTLVSESIITIMHREYREILLDKQFRTLGHEKITGLHKSKNRRREYDHNESLHKTMNKLFLLPEDAQDYIADKSLILLQYIQRYLNLCAEMRQESRLEDIRNITHFYLEQGAEEVDMYLNGLREIFYTEFHNQQSLPTPLPEPGDTDVSDDKVTSKPQFHGLRIKRFKSS